METQEENPSWAAKAWSHLSSVRLTSPLIQCITNFVSMDLMANTLLSAGASPAMIHSLQEIPEFTPHVHALCINVGTLTSEWLPAMKSAAQLANQLGKPWVLDPVAAGASSFRLKACLELVGLNPTVIRGNGSEIIALSNASSAGPTKHGSGFSERNSTVGKWTLIDATSGSPNNIGSRFKSQSKVYMGVDSSHESTDAIEAAKFLAQATGSIVAVSGAIDIVTDGRRVVGTHNGVALMKKITATGCSVTSLIAAFVAVDPSNAFEATASAFSIFGIAGEMGIEIAKGPASLRMHMIDSLYGLDQVAVTSRAKISNFS